MRIWYISPQYFDKKGLLAQWNEGNILKNIIVENKKVGGWVNHPFSKRVLRYKKKNRRTIMNTYLKNIRDYGVEKMDIKFKEKYLEKEFVNDDIRVPILAEHIESDFDDALFKMKTRDRQIYKKLKAFKKEKEADQYVKNVELIKPYYLEMNLDKYKESLSRKYLKFCEENKIRLCGSEIPEGISDKWDKVRGTNQKEFPTTTLIEVPSDDETKTTDDIIVQIQTGKASPKSIVGKNSKENEDLVKATKPILTKLRDSAKSKDNKKKTLIDDEENETSPNTLKQSDLKKQPNKLAKTKTDANDEEEISDFNILKEKSNSNKKVEKVENKAKIGKEEVNQESKKPRSKSVKKK